MISKSGSKKLAVMVALVLPLYASSGGKGASHAVAAKAAHHDVEREDIRAWFSSYDGIRRAAQMTGQERSLARKLLTAGGMPGERNQRNSGQKLLSAMVARYAQANQQFNQLNPPPEVLELQRGYETYFQHSLDLFSDYLKAAGSNSAASGHSILAPLNERRKALQSLDKANKALDKKLRQKFNIPAFRG